MDLRQTTFFQVLSTGNVAAELCIYYSWLAQIGINALVSLDHSGYMPTGRNKGINEWLYETPYEFMIQCDQDTVPPLDVMFLAAHDVDLVGCLYLCAKDNGPAVGAQRFNGSKTFLPRPADAPRLQEVAWVGTGCYCIRRGAALKLIEAYGRVFDFDFDERGEKGAGVDILLCRRMHELGMKVHLDVDMTALHAKRMRWVPQPDGKLSFFPWMTYYEAGNVPSETSAVEPPGPAIQRVKHRIEEWAL